MCFDCPLLRTSWEIVKPHLDTILSLTAIAATIFIAGRSHRIAKKNALNQLRFEILEELKTMQGILAQNPHDPPLKDATFHESFRRIPALLSRETSMPKIEMREIYVASQTGQALTNDAWHKLVSGAIEMLRRKLNPTLLAIIAEIDTNHGDTPPAKNSPQPPSTR